MSINIFSIIRIYMSEKFTVIIRSSDQINSNDNSNNCTIRLVCPSQFRHLQCKVMNFYLNVEDNEVFGTNSLVELYTEGLDIVSGSDSKFNSMRSIAFTDLKSQSTASCPVIFNVDNFHNKTVRFELRGADGGLLQSDPSTTVLGDYDGKWILILECEPI